MVQVLNFINAQKVVTCSEKLINWCQIWLVFIVSLILNHRVLDQGFVGDVYALASQELSFSPMNVLYWGHAKNIVWIHKTLNLVYLTWRNATAVSYITPVILQRILVEVDYRLDVWRANIGTHIKKYLAPKQFLIVFKTTIKPFFY